MKDIKEIIVKSIISAQPFLAHQYRSCQPENFMNNMCFQILGFDIMLDSKLKPWLLEVNHTPSFVTDTPLDLFIKQNVITDALALMNINPKTKTEILNSRKEEQQRRVYTGKTKKLTQEEKIKEIYRCQILRDEYEKANCGGYERIFPPSSVNFPVNPS
jgi:tubulin polyglutamylase TTLL6/13